MCIRDRVRAIENSATKEFVNEQKKLLNLIDKKKISLREAQLEIEHFWAGSLKNAVINGDIENGSLMAGQSVSMDKEIQPTTKIFSDLLTQIDKQLISERRNHHA